MKEKFYMKDSPRRNFRGSMKRFAAVLGLAAMMLLTPAAVHAAEITIDLGAVVNGTYTGWTVDASSIRLNSSSDTYVLTGTETGSRFVEITVATTVTLNNAGISTSITPALDVNTAGSVNLILAGTNSVAYTGSSGIMANDGVSLTISGSGSLNCTGGSGRAIFVSNGTLYIAGGTVTATGGTDGINIGSSGTLNITGGTVTATGGSGDGINNSMGTGTVDISGGTVTATGGSGDGINNSGSGTLDITGGSVSGAINGSVTTPGSITVISGLPKNAAVTGISIPGYGVNGVKTDGSGNLYLYLPAATATFDVTIGGIVYVFNNAGGWHIISTSKKPDGDTPVDCGLVKGTPNGWSGSYDTTPNVYYSGQEIKVKFYYTADPSKDRTVKIKLTDSIADYFTAPETVTLGFDETSVDVPLTVRQLTADRQGITLGTGPGAGAVEAQIDDKPKDIVSNFVPAGTIFYNALDLCNTVTIDFTPASPYYNGNIGVSVVNGKDYTYRYSLDEGYTWSDAISENSIDITPYSAEYILIRAANSYNYIHFDLVGSGLPPVPPGLTRTVQIPGTASLGLAIDKGAGVHYVTLGGEFTFTVTPTTPIPAGKKLSVQTDPAASAVDVKTNADGTYTVMIEGISKNTKVSFDIITGNEGIASTRVYSAGNTLHIATAQAATVQIYSVTGQLVKAIYISGEATLTLPAGLYLVKTADRVYKISIR